MNALEGFQEYVGPTTQKLQAIWNKAVVRGKAEQLPVPTKHDFPWEAISLEEQALGDCRWQNVFRLVGSCGMEAQLCIPTPSMGSVLHPQIRCDVGSIHAIGYLLQYYLRRLETWEEQVS